MRSDSDLHRDWLGLLDTDGPFLSVPALKKAWPTGMPVPDRAALDALRDAKPAFEKAWDVWDMAEKATADQAAAALAEYRQARDTWVDVVLRAVLGWKNFYLTPASVDLKVHAPDYSVTVSPTGALTRSDMTGALVLVTDPVESLRVPLDDGWAASPIDRMEELLRASGVRVGVVTDGRWWAIVSARPETMVASGITDSQRWIELPVVRDAFINLLRLPRLVGKREEDLLTTLFGDSVAAAEEITEALGTNVRRAVELLVQALSESALDARRRGEPDPLPARRDDVYQAAVTMMMRVVFLLFAEERGLLPQTQLFTGGYGISDELDTLDQRARDEGAEALDRTHLTWHRLLATSQALYRGASFEDIRIPSYGGSLFDSDRFSFLITRDAHDTLAVAVSDRVMLEVLRAAQMAELRGEPARRISFRDIDVEQIGYIYEGLLGYSCTDVDEVIVGLIGKKGEEPEIPLVAPGGLRGEAQQAGRHSRTRSPPGRRPTSPPQSPDPRPPSRRRSRAPQKSKTPTGRCARRCRPTRACGTGSARSSARSAATCETGRRSSSPAALSWWRRRPGRRRARTTRRSPSPPKSSSTPSNPSSTAPARIRSRPEEVGAGRLRPDPGTEGRRHRLRLGRIPRRRRPLPLRPPRRGMAAPGRNRRHDAEGTGTPRYARGHRQMPVRRGHQRDGRRDVQALAVAGVPGPEASVLLRR